MSRKATHQGECQVCGRVQKLPKGLLSLHGYTTRCGFFEGTCLGAGRLPFEQSKDLVEGAIARASEKLAALKSEIQKRLTSTDPLDVKKMIYNGKLGRYSGYYLESGRVEERVIQSVSDPTYHYSKFFFIWEENLLSGPKTHEEEAQVYIFNASLANVVEKLNEIEADRLSQIVKEIESYIAWQQQRLKGWKVKPLTSVKVTA